MKTHEAREMYSTFLNRLKQEYIEDRIKGNLNFIISSNCKFYIKYFKYIKYKISLFADGVFGAMMIVNIVNDVDINMINHFIN